MEIMCWVSPRGQDIIYSEKATIKDLAIALNGRTDKEIKQFLRNFPKMKAGGLLLSEKIQKHHAKFFTTIAQGERVKGFSSNDLLGWQCSFN